ncbi:MAG TPA: hypothetical protein VE218_09740 [Acidobacteriaceae bacterium]|nr:hypothetical protein [Acidobacteriaceae bacterium]
MKPPLHNYRMGPFLYITDLLLPELPLAAPEESERTVQIRLGATPATLSAPLASDESYEANDTEFLLRLPGVGTYYVHHGKEIIVNRDADAPELDIRSYLLGNLFAVICHQRGLLPLHASAIATPRGAVAFLGASGAGKSSIAAFLARRGHRFLADDICLVDPAAPRDRRVLPTAPWLKLWDGTLDAMGEPKTGLSRIFSDDEKYRYVLPQHDAPSPLTELILLERAEEQTEASFERLTPVHALHAVLDQTYQSWLVRATGRTERYFLRCGEALDGVRVTRMRRPWGFAAMEATLKALEAHLDMTPGN